MLKYIFSTLTQIGAIAGPAAFYNINARRISPLVWFGCFCQTPILLLVSNWQCPCEHLQEHEHTAPCLSVRNIGSAPLCRCIVVSTSPLGGGGTCEVAARYVCGMSTAWSLSLMCANVLRSNIQQRLWTSIACRAEECLAYQSSPLLLLKRYIQVWHLDVHDVWVCAPGKCSLLTDFCNAWNAHVRCLQSCHLGSS